MPVVFINYAAKLCNCRVCDMAARLSRAFSNGEVVVIFIWVLNCGCYVWVSMESKARSTAETAFALSLPSGHNGLCFQKFSAVELVIACPNYGDRHNLHSHTDILHCNVAPQGDSPGRCPD
ncbi:hypothetical protein J6590_023730 [Homalodisca vitripennis]|nr:hypothetical protein J6590_023730 [Homalodisca vitripennis]